MTLHGVNAFRPKKITGQAISPPKGSTAGPTGQSQPFLTAPQTTTVQKEVQPFPQPQPQVAGDTFQPAPSGNVIGPSEPFDPLNPPPGPPPVEPTGPPPGFPPPTLPFHPDPFDPQDPTDPGGPIESPPRNDPVPLEELAGLIEDLLGNPTAFEEVMPRIREAMTQLLQENVDTDTSRRGVLFSTVRSGQLARGFVGIEASLQTQLAQAKDRQLNRAIELGLDFMREAQNADEFLQDLQVRLLELGILSEQQIDDIIRDMRRQL